MAGQRFVALGHIVEDTEPSNHLGGGVSYSAVAAARLGYEAHIITKCPKNHPYLSELEKLGVRTHVLPTNRLTITKFKNTYDINGKRKQESSEQQEDITADDLPSFPKGILKNATIAVAPVVGEVDPELFPLLSEQGSVSVLAQGYFRKIQTDGTITQKEWDPDRNAIISTGSVILSDEDITMDGNLDTGFLDRLKSLINIVVLTQGEKGSIVYSDASKTRAGAFELRPNEIRDFTGAGDCYAAAFTTRYKQRGNIRKAALFASFYAAVKIIGLGGTGIASIPAAEEIRQFMSQNPGRVSAYLEENEALKTDLF